MGTKIFPFYTGLHCMACLENKHKTVKVKLPVFAIRYLADNPLL